MALTLENMMDEFGYVNKSVVSEAEEKIARLAVEVEMSRAEKVQIIKKAEEEKAQLINYQYQSDMKGIVKAACK
ncbi:MAG: hypothetical protein LBS84_08530 [Clostridiales bacterium]|nr:hypothetical protein [Clostridiales bacterium]